MSIVVPGGVVNRLVLSNRSSFDLDTGLLEYEEDVRWEGWLHNGRFVGRFDTLEDAKQAVEWVSDY